MSKSLSRLGSPSSIPSSPTSVHSSSSAIFERDIEPIASPSPPNSAHPPNPHRIPRAKATEQLDQSVPSVLDSAAEALSAPPSDDTDTISVLAPAPQPDRSQSGLASPIGSIRSRSPSPPARAHQQPAPRATLLLSIPSPTQLQLQHPVAHLPALGTPAPYAGPVVPPTAAFPATAADPTFPPNVHAPPSPAPRPVIQTILDQPSTPPAIITPTSAYFSTASSAPDSPATTTRDHPPPPPGPAGAKRLSFMSYSDLLASAPAAVLPLSSLTTSASSEPPPHIPSVTGVTQQSGVAMPVREDAAMDDVGGEWEREGLGKGLEERLEALMAGRA